MYKEWRKGKDDLKATIIADLDSKIQKEFTKEDLLITVKDFIEKFNIETDMEAAKWT